jgi:alkylation response protein AidB-like acyl-CoA dehydrogenase
MTRYAVAWMATGCAMGAYEAALKYARQRMQFGKPIGSFQLVEDLLAKMIADFTASQCVITRQAQLHADGKLTDAPAALAKAFCTAKCRETVAWAREVLGGNGIVADYEISLPRQQIATWTERIYGAEASVRRRFKEELCASYISRKGVSPELRRMTARAGTALRSAKTDFQALFPN